MIMASHAIKAFEWTFSKRWAAFNINMFVILNTIGDLLSLYHNTSSNVTINVEIGHLELKLTFISSLKVDIFLVMIRSLLLKKKPINIWIFKLFVLDWKSTEIAARLHFLNRKCKLKIKPRQHFENKAFSWLSSDTDILSISQNVCGDFK